jgi:hypothetical protein
LKLKLKLKSLILILIKKNEEKRLRIKKKPKSLGTEKNGNKSLVSKLKMKEIYEKKTKKKHFFILDWFLLNIG